MDENNAVAAVLSYLRDKRGVSRELLFQGLCAKSSYSQYEQGKRLPDRLLLNAFLQRLGCNPDKLSTMLSGEEYEYFRWKKQVLAALSKENMEELQALLEKPVEIMNSSKNLQQQFINQMRAIVAERVEHNMEACTVLLEQAAELTMPGIHERGLGRYLISPGEMEIFLHLAETLAGAKRESEARKLLWEIICYAEKNYNDYESKVMIYPKAVKQLTPLLLEQQKNMEGMLLCKNAIELLCVQDVLYDMAELMEYYLKFSENFQETEEAHRYQKQLQALREVYQENGAELYLKKNMVLTYSNRETYLIEEVIKRGRMVKSYTQEELSEKINVSWETVSRIENGKRSPSTRNFRSMMETLDMGLDYYNSELDTTDFLLLEKYSELERAMSLKRWKDARQLLEELKAKLDMDRPGNQRTLRAEENCIRFNMGEIDGEEFLKECEAAIDCEGEGWRDENFWKQFLTKYKVTVLNYMAILYRIGHELEKSIFILEHVLDQLVSSKVSLEDRYKSSMTVIGNLSSYYGEAGRFEDCIKMCDVGIKLCFDSGRGVTLGIFLSNKAEALNRMSGESSEISKHYLKQGYYLAELMSDHNVSAYIDEYYLDHYKQNITWD